MQYLDLTYPTPAENLACDEALLEFVENNPDSSILRFWQPRDYFIVLGYSNKIKEEIIRDKCHDQPGSRTRPRVRLSIPIFRRISGGGTVLQGPGCLNYSLILPFASYPSLKFITSTNSFLLNSHKKALQPLLDQEIQTQGHTDLTIHNRKFSGNSQKRKKNALLFHGTFLLDFDISLLDKVLPIPAKQPLYRKNRPHSDFLTNLHLPASSIKSTLRDFWKATNPFPFTLTDTFYHLVKTKYSAHNWNYKL